MGFQPDHILNFLHHPLRFRAGQVYLIDHRNDVKIMVQGQVYIGQGLGLNPLGGIHHQHGPIAGRQGTADFIVKVHMSRGVNQVQNIFLPILRLIYGADCLGLDGNPPLPLQVHIVENLGLHLPACEKSRVFDDAVRQSGLAVIYMGNNAKIPDFALFKFFR